MSHLKVLASGRFSPGWIVAVVAALSTPTIRTPPEPHRILHRYVKNDHPFIALFLQRGFWVIAFLVMEDYNSETDSDYTSYWRDWVSRDFPFLIDGLDDSERANGRPNTEQRQKGKEPVVCSDCRQKVQHDTTR